MPCFNGKSIIDERSISLLISVYATRLLHLDKFFIVSNTVWCSDWWRFLFRFIFKSTFTFLWFNSKFFALLISTCEEFVSWKIVKINTKITAGDKWHRNILILIVLLFTAAFYLNFSWILCFSEYFNRFNQIIIYFKNLARVKAVELTRTKSDQQLSSLVKNFCIFNNTRCENEEMREESWSEDFSWEVSSTHRFLIKQVVAASFGSQILVRRQKGKICSRSRAKKYKALKKYIIASSSKI